MVTFLHIFIVLITFFVMEWVAWATHKYIMHGLLWSLHEDHHKKGPHFFEKNDWFFVINAVPSIVALFLGTYLPNAILVCIGIGILLYGLAYFLVHEIIIHQRFKWLTRSNSLYIKAVRRAHKMHHKHLQKEHGESFGMLVVSKRYWDMVRNVHHERTS